MSKDPTQTLALRRRAASEVQARFNRVKRAVRSAFNPGGLLANIQLADPDQFKFTRDEEAVPEFDDFLQEQIDEEILAIREGILESVDRNKSEHWLNRHVGEGYRRGATKTRLAAKRNIPQMLQLDNYNPFASPAHVKRAELIFQRVYSDLEGVTQTMSKQMSRVLSEGIVKGEQPKKVGKAMADRIDKIGITRGKLIARTEIIESHNTASIKEAELLEKETGVKIMMKWHTSIDGRQRDSHEARHGKVYTRDRAQELIGEPNCRCSVSAVFGKDAENK